MRNHPAALPFLFFTEMWERFGYYLMIGIFTLYMTDTKAGGLGFERGVSADIFGTFIALVYLTPFIGGLLADRLLGFRKSIIIGGILMGIGYILLAIPNNLNTFYLSLGIIILGNGFFKPNISTLLGNLYNKDKYRALKDDGYSIFYMGINIGALVCNFVAAYLRNTYGWGYAFVAAGIGMFIGVIVFIVGMKHYADADVKKTTAEPGSAGLGALLSSVLIPAVVTGIAAWYIPGNLFGSDSTDAFLFGAMPVVGFYIWTLIKAAPDEKPRIRALLAVYAVVIVFWAVFKQNGTALTTWAEFYTERSMPPTMEATAKFMGATQTVTMEKDTFPIYDTQFRTTKNPETGKPKMDFNSYPPYFQNILPEERPAEGQSIKLVSTEIFPIRQSLLCHRTYTLADLVFQLAARPKAGTDDTGQNRDRTHHQRIVHARYRVGRILLPQRGRKIVRMVGNCHVRRNHGPGNCASAPWDFPWYRKLAPARLAGLMMGGWQLSDIAGQQTFRRAGYHVGPL